jgi:hypothetical protein
MLAPQVFDEPSGPSDAGVASVNPEQDIQSPSITENDPPSHKEKQRRKTVKTSSKAFIHSAVPDSSNTTPQVFDEPSGPLDVVVLIDPEPDMQSSIITEIDPPSHKGKQKRKIGKT